MDQDDRGGYAQVLLKYFLSQGLVSGHNLFVATAETDPNRVVQALYPQHSLEEGKSAGKRYAIRRLIVVLHN